MQSEKLVRLGRVAQQKHVLQKPKDRSSTPPSTHVKSQVWPCTYLYPTSVEGQKQGDWGLLAAVSKESLCYGNKVGKASSAHSLSSSEVFTHTNT